MARVVPTHLQRIASARDASEHEQRRRLVRQRRAVDHPELSMQCIVWTETKVVGPRQYDGVLPQPKATKDFYRDIAVFAYPTPATGYTIPRIRGKSAAVWEEVPLRTTFPALAADAVVPRERIVNVTEKLGKDGRLTWDVPAGNWTLLRMGHTTTGKDNHPAPLDGRGLECDKLSKEAAEVALQRPHGQAHRRQSSRWWARTGRWSRRTSTVGRSVRRTGRRSSARSSSDCAATIRCRCCR